MILPDHPEVRWAEHTGYPSWKQEDDHAERCCECGTVLYDDEDTYECRTHRILCKDCLLMLHKRYV